MDDYEKHGQKLVEKALRAGADQAEVFILSNDSMGFSIQNNGIEASSSGDEIGLSIRIIKDKRIGFAYATSLHNEDNIIKQALSSSKLSDPVDYSFPQPTNLPMVKGTHDKHIPQLTPDECTTFLSDIIETANNTHPSITVSGGGLNLGESKFSLVNSQGLEFSQRETFLSTSASTLFKGKETTTGFNIEESHMLNVDFQQIGRKAAEMALNMRNPKKMKSKKTTVIFTPFSIQPLLEFIVVPGLYGDQAMKGSTYFSEKTGSQVTDSSFTLYDDPLLDNGLNSCSIDDEGSPSQKTMLIDQGVLQGFLFDGVTASQYNEKSTSNGVRAEGVKGVPQIAARNLVIKSSNSHSIAELIENTTDGVLVYDLLGAHTSNPVSGDFSVSSSVLFRIENGQITYPLKEAMLAGNIFESLDKNIAIGDDYKQLSGSFSPINVVTPSVKLPGIDVIF